MRADSRNLNPWTSVGIFMEFLMMSTFPKAWGNIRFLVTLFASLCFLGLRHVAQLSVNLKAIGYLH